MITTAAELKDTFRIEVDDLPKEDADTSSCLWSDADIYRYMNSAASLLARRVRSLFKNYTLPVLADQPMIRLPADRIYKVRRAYLTAARRDLVPLNLNDDTMRAMDYGVTLRSAHWETSTGTPTSFVLDYTPGYLRLAPIPTAADALQLFCEILPAALTAEMPLPFTDQDDLDILLLWMKKLAYEKHDADTHDLNRAKEYERQFNARVYEREPEKRRMTRTPGTVRSSW